MCQSSIWDWSCSRRASSARLRGPSSWIRDESPSQKSWGETSVPGSARSSTNRASPSATRSPDRSTRCSIPAPLCPALATGVEQGTDPRQPPPNC
ncbi:hypothetical protein Rumeso_01256 [Rubellimicrobium mesophilum DSM 19309]|uniref:Uncharacterized protein n=1 Tax=Rubellimicrobium mesophilum DSM 19309 TaxID=442562 RepID=A0A017HTS8_9RHOB|nr:hypothetical protein Rumeso_01256 [Rubellimicrobium mesophilum DSM 19309]